MPLKTTNVTIVKRIPLSIDEHAERIIQRYESVRTSIFEFIDAIRDAQKDLGDALAQHEVGKLIGIQESMFSRWCLIAQSPLIKKVPNEQLPSSLNALYQIGRLEKIYLEGYKNGEEKLLKLCEKGTISNESPARQIQVLIEKEKEREERKIQKKLDRDREKQTQNRENDVLGLSQGSLPTDSKHYSIKEAQKLKLRFRGFLIVPTKEIISKWRDEFVSEIEIGDKFPLHELRAPSMKQSNVALVKVSMKDLEVGLKILRSFGYSYRDCFIPNQPYKGSVIVSKEEVVLRGERGKTKRLKINLVETSNIDDLASWMEVNYTGPFASVFVGSGHPEFSTITL